MDDNQNIVAVLGVDMDSKVYWNNIYTNIAIPILSTIFVLLIMIIGLILKQKKINTNFKRKKLLSTARHELQSSPNSTLVAHGNDVKRSKKIKQRKRRRYKNIHTKIGQLKDNVNKIIEEKII